MGIIISRLFKVSFVRSDEAEFMYMHKNYIVFETLYILGLPFDINHVSNFKAIAVQDVCTLYFKIRRSNLLLLNQGLRQRFQAHRKR